MRQIRPPTIIYGLYVVPLHLNKKTIRKHRQIIPFLLEQHGYKEQTIELSDSTDAQRSPPQGVCEGGVHQWGRQTDKH